MPKISVIVPCYNQEKYIAECLNSVLAQTFTDYEVIVVNDGSTDSSLQIISQYTEKYKNIKVINQVNQGVVVSRNNGIAKAQGTYIFPLDGDDVITPDCLKKLYETIISTDNRVVFCECKTFGAYAGYFKQPKLSRYEMYGLHENCVISALFYKSDFEKFGGYKIAFNGYSGDDMDYWLNYIDHNLPMIRLKEILFWYRTKAREESLWKNYSLDEFRKRVKYKNDLLLKYHPKMRFWAILYKVLHCKLAKIFYRKKFTKSGKMIVKIFGIPVFKMEEFVSDTSISVMELPFYPINERKYEK